jgi:hypothetical protein
MNMLKASLYIVATVPFAKSVCAFELRCHDCVSMVEYEKYSPPPVTTAKELLVSNSEDREKTIDCRLKLIEHGV